MFRRELIEDLRAQGYRRRAWGPYVQAHLRLAFRVIEERPAAVRSLLANAALLFVLLFLAALALTLERGDGLGGRLFGAGALWLAGQGIWILLHLGLLVDLGGRPVNRLGLPNALSLFRGMTAIPLVLLGAAGEVGLLGAVYAAGALSDVADGVVARRRGQVTRLGIIMDPVVDIAWNLAVILALHAAGLLPGWAVGLAAVRYGLLLSGSAALYLRNAGLRIRSTRFGKLTGTVLSSAVLLVVVNRFGTPPAAAGAVHQLLQVLIGFLLAGGILHALVLGVVNGRAPERAREPVGQVVGHISS